MERRLSCIAGAAIAAAWSGGVSAQLVQPTPLVSGQAVQSILGAGAPARADGAPYACYAVETAPGDTLAVTLESADFAPALQIARGALCSASALQQQVSQPAPGQARIDFPAAGGRYLILAGAAAPGASGAYALRVEGASAAAPVQVAGLEAPPPPLPGRASEEERQAIMAREAAEREARLAMAEAERLRQEAEAARQAAESAARMAALEAQWAAESSYYDSYNSYDDYEEPDIAGAFMQGLMGGFAEAAQDQYELEHAFDDTNAMIAQMQAEEAARQAEAEWQAQQQRLAAQQEQAQQAAYAAQQRADAAARAAQQQAEEAAARAATAREAAAATPAFADAGGGSGANISFADAGEAMTSDDDPAMCTSNIALAPNTNCNRGYFASVTNSCSRPVEARICLETEGGSQDCGRITIQPGATGSYPSCFGTDRTSLSVRYVE